ncbi:MAG: hypothetical protein ACTHM1_04260 [Solirubrobacteraceae bacterium]
MHDCVVVDTNVLAVAEGMHSNASDDCLAACVSAVRQMQEGLVIAVDVCDEILAEYMKVLGESKMAGLGQKMAKKLWRSKNDRKVCLRISITPVGAPADSYEEVPHNLRDFDPADHKFIAVANANGGGRQIFQAVDKEWWDRRHDFVHNGIDVQFLCHGDMMRLRRRLPPD